MNRTTYYSRLRRSRGLSIGELFPDVVDPLVAHDDGLLAPDPAVPVLLLLTEYRGQQVLWQDPACTVPVEEIGDPIGGVRHPETGEILAVQDTDADRPGWGGREVGAEFDGGSYMLPVDARDTSLPMIWSGWTAYFDGVVASGASNSAVIGALNSGVSEGYDATLNSGGVDGDARIFRRSQDSVSNSRYTDVHPVDVRVQAAFITRDDGEGHRFYQGDDVRITGTGSASDVVDDWQYDPVIFGRNSRGTVDKILTGECRSLVLYDREISEQTFEDIRP